MAFIAIVCSCGGGAGCIPPAEEKTIARKTKAEVAHPRCMGSTIVSTAASRLLNVPCLVKQTLSATSLLG